MERPVFTPIAEKKTRPFRCALGRRSPDPQTPISGQFPQPAARLSERDTLPTREMIDDAKYIFAVLGTLFLIILAAPLWVPVLV